MVSAFTAGLCRPSVTHMSADTRAGEPRQLLAYCNRETRQRWRRGGREPSAGGLALWLPGGVALELRMVPAVSRGAAADTQVNTQHAVLWIGSPACHVCALRNMPAPPSIAQLAGGHDMQHC